jgi:hypothetical protein
VVEDPRLERAYEDVELVRGIGNPRLGRLCVMSFVAYLAGDCHTDRPRCASPVIRSMAVLINDQMPPATHQRLKVFVPRIIGTNDGLDDVRVKILARAVLDEILPRVARDERQVRAVGRERSVFGRLWIRTSKRALVGRIRTALAELKAEAECGVPSGLQGKVANATAQLIALCARDAPTPYDEALYWDQAIDLLDQLCDVGAESRAWSIQEERLEKLGKAAEAHTSERGLPGKPAVGSSPFDFRSLFSGGTTAKSG